MVAQHKNIALPANIREKVWEKFSGFSPETTTSMHSDYLSKKGKTEVQSLTGYIVEQARKYHLEVPKYQKMYRRLIEK